MAKKKNSSGPNMSEEIRKVLAAKPTASNKEIFERLVKKFGKGQINEASCGVAASGARKKLGIGKTRKTSVKRKKPGRPAGKRGPGRPPKTARGTSASVGGVNMDALKAAKALLSSVDGDDSAAIAAIRQLHSLQLD